MLNVPPKLRKDVEALKELGAMPQRRRLQSLAHSRRPDDSSVNEQSATSVSLDVHPTVLISTAPMNEKSRHTLQKVHDWIQESSRVTVLDCRRNQSGRELNGLLRHVFQHMKDDPRLIQQRATKGVPSVMVPTLQELMNAINDERMYFEDLTNSSSPAVLHQSLARQIQYLIDELGTAKERSETYEQQYKLLLLEFAKQSEQLVTVDDQRQNVALQLVEQTKALESERSHAAEAARESAIQINTLRESLKEAMEANFNLMQGAGGGGSAGGGGGKLPPLRSARKSTSSTLASIMGVAAADEGGGHRSSNASRAATPREQVPQGSAGVATAGGGGVALSIDEKEKYLTTINNMRKEMDTLRQEAADAIRERDEMATHLAFEKDRVEIAEKAGQMEVSTFKGLLQSVRDGHMQQLAQLERSLAESRATCASQSDAIDKLQQRLKESTARLLSLQNLLLSGPSVQSLLVSAATAQDAQGASDSLDDLAERINTFADEFSEIRAEDVTKIKSQMKAVLTGEPNDVPSPETQDSTLQQSEAPPADEAPHATQKSRRSKVQLNDAMSQTDDVCFSDPLASSTAPPLSPLLTKANAGGAGRVPTPKVSAKKSDNTLKRQSSAGIEKIAEEIAVSFAGVDEQIFRDRVELSPEKSPVPTSSGSPGEGGDTSGLAALPNAPAPTAMKGKQPAAKPPGKKPSAKGKKSTAAPASSVGATAVEEDEGDGGLNLQAVNAEIEIMKRASSQVKMRGIAMNFDAIQGSMDATNEIASNLERMAAMRKQLSASADQIFALQQALEKEKKAAAEVVAKQAEQAKLHSKDSEKISGLVKQLDLEKRKSDKTSERLTIQLAEQVRLQEELLTLREAKDLVEDALQSKIAELEKIIDKFKNSDLRTMMLNKERQFLEVCERAIRCLMSAEATSVCPLCLSRLSNPITLAPCGHSFCEHCFLLHQSEKDVSLPSDAYDGVQTIFNYRRALVQFHEDEERAQADFLAGLIPLPPESKRPPKPPTGYLCRATYVRCLTGCYFHCPECEKLHGVAFLHQTRLEELVSKIEYIGAVVTELQEMGKQRYSDEIRSSDPTSEIELEKMKLGDRSGLSVIRKYVDLEATNPDDSSSDEG